jgi:hypothetical protein
MADLGTFDGAADELVETIRKIAEIRRVPKDAPDNNSMFPFAVLQPLSGHYRGLNRGQMIGLHNITVELHVKKYELSRAQDELKDMLDEIPKRCTLKLQNEEFTNIHQWDRIEYISGPMEWAGVNTLGVMFTFIDVKVVSSLS